MRYLILIFLSFIFSQGLNTNLKKNEKNKILIESINNISIKEELFLFPLINRTKRDQKINLFKNISRNLKLEPVLALRYSNSSFEIDNSNTPSDVTWITPGIHFEGQIPILYNFTSMWIYLWVDFYKHAAYGFNENAINHGKKLSQYNPILSIEYYEPVDESFKGIEFDEGQGGIAILNPNFNIIMGKLKSNLGPFFRDNLSISSSNPSFQQFRINKKFQYKESQIYFTYLIGSLVSGIIDSAKMNNFFLDIDDNIRRPNVERYVALHRLDLKLKNNFRIGFYEKIIFGARSIPFEYLNPIVPYWSIQHSLGDLDNLIMGFDFTYLFRNMRIIGSFFMDEWDPYKTFNKNNRNWFGYQLGLSYLPEAFTDKVLFKLEYTKLDPRVYNHRFDINTPSHHDYNLGFWTGGHARDVWLSMVYFMSDFSSITLSLEDTKIGSQSIYNQYNDIDIEFLNEDTKDRKVVSFVYSNYKMKYFDYKIFIKSFNTANLGYNKESFFETSFSLFYNIPY